MNKCKRKGWIIGLIWLGIVCSGCGQTVSAPEKEEPIASAENTNESQESEAETEETIPEETTSEETAPETGTDLTFEDLSKRQFWFSSGAGGWGEEFTIEKNGYFAGVYHDSEMGSTGEGYPNGTMYSSTYSGNFTDLTKEDEYTYKMTLSDIIYEEEIGKEEILDEMKYIYTESYALGGSDTFYIYLPGTPVSRFSEEVWIWLQSGNESETELTMTAIVDEDNQYGICSTERMTPVDEARMAYETYKESYDYYAQKLSEAMTTLEMNEAVSEMYEVSDQCLNELWDVICYNVSEEAYEEILTQQREWISEKEAAGEASAEALDGGTLAPVDTMITQAEMTIQRCQVLLQYIENNCKTPDE